MVVRSAFLTPGAHPLAELAEAIPQAVGRPEEARNIEHSLASEPDEALSRLAALCQNKPLLLVVDQFEELFTMCRDPEEQNASARVLGALSNPILSPGASVAKFCLPCAPTIWRASKAATPCKRCTRGCGGGK